MRVLFVCTGNTCRSPIAEALFRQKIQKLGKNSEIEVRSAGLYQFKSTSVSSHTLTVLAEYGIQFERKPQGINPELFEWAQRVLTMTSHKYMALSLYPEIINKIFTLKEFVGQNSFDISDPVGKSLSRYRQCALEIDESLDLLYQKLAHFPHEACFVCFPRLSSQSLPLSVRLFRLLIEAMRLSKKTNG